MLNPNLSVYSGTLTAAAAQTGVAISALPAPSLSEYTICCQITNLSAASGVPQAVIAVEDSVDAFTNKVTRALFEFSGTIGGSGVIVKRRITPEAPAIRIGTTSATVRANLMELNGTTPTVTFAVWIE